MNVKGKWIGEGREGEREARHGGEWEEGREGRKGEAKKKERKKGRNRGGREGATMVFWEKRGVEDAGMDREGREGGMNDRPITR